MARRRVDLQAVEHESIGAALVSIGELLGVPADQLHRLQDVPAVRDFLELLEAGRVAQDHRSLGRSKAVALDFAAAALGVPSETLRTRIRRGRAAAYRTSRRGRRKVHFDTGAPAEAEYLSEEDDAKAAA